jgi:hypothetical protein
MQIIESAENATSEISEKVHEAIARLNHCQGRVVNGFGIFSDPSSRKADLLNAKRAIESALAVANETNWPSQVDYQHAED